MRQTATRCWRCAVPSIMARSTKYLCVIDSDYEKRQNDRMQGWESHQFSPWPSNSLHVVTTCVSLPDQALITRPDPSARHFLRALRQLEHRSFHSHSRLT